MTKTKEKPKKKAKVMPANDEVSRGSVEFIVPVAQPLAEKLAPGLLNLEWEGPVKDQTATHDWHVWTTKDGMYRVIRSVGRFDVTDTYFAACIGKAEIISYYKTLLRALEACRIRHLENHNLSDDDVSTNERTVWRKAEEMGLDLLPGAPPPPKPKEPIQMPVVMEYVGKETVKTNIVKVNKAGVPVVMEKKPEPRPVKEKKPKPAPRKPEERLKKGQHTVLGKSVSSVLRWMGRDGWTEQQADKVMRAFGIILADSSIRSQIRAARKGDTRGLPAELTKKEAKQLRGMR